MKRRMMALLLAGVMAATMCGCGSKSDEKKVYKVATDTTFAPFEFENDEGNMVGIDLDLLKAIAEDQGFEYELEYVGFSAAVTALEAGEVDAVIAGMLAGSDIKSYEDLAGKQVAAKIGAEGCAFAESIADQYGFTIAQFEDSATMFQDVLAGTSAAVFDDYPVIGYEITRGIGLSLPMPMERGSSYGIATLKGKNPELVEMLNKGLADLKESGKYDEIVNTYISK